MKFFNWLFNSNDNQNNNSKNSPKSLDAVPGALSASYEGKIVYNMLTPHMQQFLGRCTSAIKKAGIKAKGTGQFSILIGDAQDIEIKLSNYYIPEDNPELINKVVEQAKYLINQ